MSFESAPVWSVFLGTIVLVLVCLQVGLRVGRRRQRNAQGKLEGSGAMVGAAMGLLAFMLAFTFNNAASRFDNRKALVIEEANAIGTTWLRAGFLDETHRAAMRGLLRDYVDLRVKVALGEVDVEGGLRQTDVMQDQMWAIAEETGRRDSGSITTGLFIQALNDVIDIHLKRLTVGIRNRVPATIWVTLYLLLFVGMIMMGIQLGLSPSRHFFLELALAATFSLVLLLIADLDRPQEGLMRVSQQAMVDLQTKLHKP
jgi:hypothetical protein